MNRDNIKKIAFLLTAGAFLLLPSCCPEFSRHAPGIAVITGVVFSMTCGNPFAQTTAKMVSPLLGTAIVGIGCGMNLFAVLRAGADGILYTIIGIAAGIGIGIWVGKRLRLNHDTMLLISIGTSICGGSAIAAAAPVLRAKAHDIAIASVTVFTLNALALLLFPAIGHALKMSQIQFGYWSALAIHDTSSVVGATLQYGPLALETGTTIKLARALWIVPVTLFLSYHVTTRNPGNRPLTRLKIPWFIPGFLIAAALVTFFPATAPVGNLLKTLSQYVMILTLFIVGANLSREKLRELGFKPILHGIILWFILAAAWGTAIYAGLLPSAQ